MAVMVGGSQWAQLGTDIRQLVRDILICTR
jgi:hypothetical protein